MFKDNSTLVVQVTRVSILGTVYDICACGAGLHLAGKATGYFRICSQRKGETVLGARALQPTRGLVTCTRSDLREGMSCWLSCASAVRRVGDTPFSAAEGSIPDYPEIKANQLQSHQLLITNSETNDSTKIKLSLVFIFV